MATASPPCAPSRSLGFGTLTRFETTTRRLIGRTLQGRLRRTALLMIPTSE